MNVGDGPINAELALWYTGVLKQFRALNPVAVLDQTLPGYFGPSYQATYLPATFQRTASYYGGDNTRKIMFVDGITTNTQASQIADAYSIGTGPTTTNANNQWFIDAASQLYGQINRPGVVLPEYIDIVGYSAGGAVGTLLLLFLQQQLPNVKTSLCTFGAPRAIGHSTLGRLTRTSIARWMCDDDPIPMIPPRFADCPVFMLATSLRVQLTWGDYVHTPGGVNLPVSGLPQRSYLPLRATINPIASLAAWFFGIETTANNAHSLNQYQTRLTTLVQLLQRPDKMDVETAAGEPAEDAPRAHSTERDRRTAAQVQHAALTQNQTAVEVEPSVLFRAVRRGRVWAVAFGDVLFTFSGNKKRARHLARAGNDFVRSLPKQAVVDPQTLVDQFIAFMEAGVQPGGPVNPPIRTSL